MALTLTTKARHEPPSTPPDAAVRSINPRSFPFRTTAARRRSRRAIQQEFRSLHLAEFRRPARLLPEIHLLPLTSSGARRKPRRSDAAASPGGARAETPPRTAPSSPRRRGARASPLRHPFVPVRVPSASSDWSHSSAACPTFRPTPAKARDGSRRARLEVRVRPASFRLEEVPVIRRRASNRLTRVVHYDVQSGKRGGEVRAQSLQAREVAKVHGDDGETI